MTLEQRLYLHDSQPIRSGNFTFTRESAGRYVDSIFQVKVVIEKKDKSGESKTGAWLCLLNGKNHNNENSVELVGDYFSTKREAIEWAVKRLNKKFREAIIAKYQTL